jgi:hypothetical protein
MVAPVKAACHPAPLKIHELADRHYHAGIPSFTADELINLT